MYKKFMAATALLATVGMAHAFVNSAISLDGYCDSFTDLTTEGQTGAAGTWQNADCNGTTLTTGGAQVRTGTSARIGYVLGSSGAAVLMPSGKEVTWWIKDDKTWTVYDWQGVVLNQGTWTAQPRGTLAPSGSAPSVIGR